MKRNLLLFTFFLLIKGLYAQNILDKNVQLQVENTPLIQIIDHLSKQTNAQFTYDKNRIPTDKKFTLIQSGSLATILKELFIGSNIQFKANKNYVILFRENIPYHTLSGYIRAAENQETLIEANIFDTRYFLGSSSNEYGFYSLSLPEGKHVLKGTYVGYQEWQDTIELYRDVSQDISLKAGNELTEVIVRGALNYDTTTTSILAESSINGARIDIEKAQVLPTFMGEKDVLKYLQLLPGVVSGGLAGNNLYIRGGSLDQNLILLDDVPLYNVNHFFGLISVFNGDIVHHAKTYVDGFPARYGGRLASIIDVRTKDGSKNAYHGGLSMGLFTTTAYLEGPLKKEKSSFVLSARRTWLDLALNQINLDPTITFYDLNAKANFKISSKDRLYLSFYTGADLFKEEADSAPKIFEEYSTADWGNNAVSLRWNRILGKKLFLNTTVLHSTFYFNVGYFGALEAAKENVTDLRYQSFIRQSALKTDFSYLPNNRHQIRFGHRYHFLQNNAGTIDRKYLINSIESESSVGVDLTKAHQWTLYVEDKMQILPALSLHTGLHVVNYRTQGKNWWFPQFRAQLSYAASKKNHWAISYSDMMQFTHLLDNASLESNNNKWVIANKNSPPSTARHIAVSFQSFFRKGWKFKGSLYYKEMKQLRRFQQGSNIFTSIQNWEAETIEGIGKNYGIEGLVGKILGRTQGWFTYTWSKSQRKFEELENAPFFPYQYDRRHVLNFTLTHQLPKKQQKERQLSFVWSFASGNWLTVPTQVFPSVNEGIPLPAIAAINNYQLPSVHRLDISYYRKRTTEKGFQHTWNFGVYNAYGRNNPYSAELQFMTPPNRFNLVSNNLSVTPIPYVTYGFKF